MSEAPTIRVLIVDDHEIAQLLTISLSTTKHHVSAIFSKLGVASRAEAIALALEQGLISDSRSE